MQSRELRAAALDELHAIRESAGTIQPPQVVERARDTGSALHAYFEWDDGAAAESYRLQQARGLIRSYTVAVRIRGEDKPQAVRAFVSLSTDRKRGHGYRALVEVIEDESQYRQLLHDAMAEMTAFRRKYALLSELDVVLQAIDKVVARAPMSSLSRAEAL